MNVVPEYQRRAVMEVIKDLESLIKWHYDQIEKTREKIRKHEKFLENRSFLTKDDNL